MMLGIRTRTAWLVGLTMAAVVPVPGSAVAESMDDRHPHETREPGQPVFVLITDSEPERNDVVFTQLQAPVDEPEREEPPALTEPVPRDEPQREEPPVLTEPVPRDEPDRAPSWADAEPSPRDRLPRSESRRRRPLATVPYMFGDFFAGGGGQSVITFPPITVVVTDGPSNLFVTNSGAQNPPFGASIDASHQIFVWNVPTEWNDIFTWNGSEIVDAFGRVAPRVTFSIGDGQDLSGDGQPDTYPVASPTVPGVLPPSAPYPGTLVYTDGTAVFADPVTGNPADGSVGQGDGWRIIANYANIPSQIVVNVPQGGAAVRRFKISEHSSPQPRRRVFFDYNFYNDVIGGLGDVSRYTVGGEETFFGGRSSIELRVPIAGTLDNEQVVGGVQMRDCEFGNLGVAFKTILYEVPTGLISAGLGVTAPTGPSSFVFMDQMRILEVNNQAVHLLPFVAAMSTPCDRWYWQAFMQLDVGANGNPARGDITGQNLSQFGVVNDATLLFLDAAVGYSLYESACARGLTRISPMAELHYSTTLQDSDVAEGNGFVISSPTRRFDVLNLTLGVSFLWNDSLSIRPAMVIPLRDDHDKQFDYEAMVQIDWCL
jgi:hypothetical protein